MCEATGPGKEGRNDLVSLHCTVGEEARQKKTRTSVGEGKMRDEEEPAVFQRKILMPTLADIVEEGI